MLIEKRLTVSYKHTAETGSLATNKKQETLHNFSKKDIPLDFVALDQDLSDLANNYDKISKVRFLIIVQQIRNKLFELCNLRVYDMDIRQFASHEPGDRTPLNSECA